MPNLVREGELKVPASDTVQKVLSYVDDHREEIISTLQTAIRTKSVNPSFDPTSAGEGAMSDFYTGYLKKLGFSIERVEVDGRPSLIATLESESNKRAGRPGTQRDVEPGPKLLFNAHMDTHPEIVGPWINPFTGELLEKWSEASGGAFSGNIVDGFIYGRGACDHKSPGVALLKGLEALQAAGVKLGGKLTVIFDADEETGGAKGMQYIAKHYPMDFDMALYGCTTDFTPLGRSFFTSMKENNIIRAMAGQQAYRFTFTGHNYHVLTPKVGLGAVEAALLFIDRLRPMMDRVNAMEVPLEGHGQPRMRVNAIDCGYRGASHHQAKTAEVIMNRRIPPGHDPKAAVKEMRDAVDTFNRDYPEHNITFEVIADTPPYVLEENSPIIQGIRRAVKKVFGVEPNITGVPSPTGASQFVAKHDIPTVLFGFGVLNFHHAIDERIHVDDLIKTTKVYAVALMELLGVE